MKKRIIAIFAVVALLLTLLAVPVFADDEATGDSEEITEDVGATGDGETTGETTGADDTTTTGADDASTTGAGDTAATDEEAAATPETSTGMTEAQKTLLIWNLVIGGVVLAIIVALVVVFFVLPKRREKTLKFFRGLKSEWKKIAWFSWKNTWKGTLVVAIVSVVIAIVIGLLDTGFSQGLNALSKFF